MLDAAVPFSHEKKCVVTIRYVADQPRRCFHHTLEIRRHLGAIDARRDVFDSSAVRAAGRFELNPFLVAHQRGAIVEHVEIRRGEGVLLTRDGVQSGSDLRPSGWQFENDRHGLPLYVQVAPVATTVGSALLIVKFFVSLDAE